MKPGYTLFFLGLVLGVLALIGKLMPEGGVKLGALELAFPDPSTLLFSAPEKKVDISDIIALKVDSLTTEVIDSLVVDTPKVPTPVRGPGRVMIAYPNDDPGMLRPALAALNGASKGARPVRVLAHLLVSRSIADSPEIANPTF